MADEEGLFDKVKSGVKSFTGTLSGKNVEELVAEQSELFTQVLLGLHRDLDGLHEVVESQRSAYKNQQANLDELSGKINHLQEQIEAHTQEFLGLRGIIKTQEAAHQANLKNLEEVSENVKNLQKWIDEHSQETANLRGILQDLNERTKNGPRDRIIGIAALVIALCALGGVLWIAL